MRHSLLPVMWIIAYCRTVVMHNAMTNIPLLNDGFSHSLEARSNELFFISVLAFKCYFLTRTSATNSTKIRLSQLFNLRKNQLDVELEFGTTDKSDFLVGDLMSQPKSMTDIAALRSLRSPKESDCDVTQHIKNGLKKLPLFYISAAGAPFGDSFAICHPSIIIQSNLTTTGKQLPPEQVIKMAYDEADKLDDCDVKSDIFVLTLDGFSSADSDFCVIT
jgi:hypothetical protein